VHHNGAHQGIESSPLVFTISLMTTLLRLDFVLQNPNYIYLLFMGFVTPHVKEYAQAAGGLIPNLLLTKSLNDGPSLVHSIAIG
jgi:hypothetical protein